MIPLTEERPMRRSMRFWMGGCVEKRLIRVSPPSSGCTMNRCAELGEATSGTRLLYAEIFSSALASA